MVAGRVPRPHGRAPTCPRPATPATPPAPPSASRTPGRTGRPQRRRRRPRSTSRPRPDMTAAPTRVAVVGSGVAGLTAAYVASRTAHVTLFEADDRLGGHADTHQVDERRDGTARHRHRLHRPQPAHLPGAAADVRRARRGDPALRDVDVDPRRRHRPGVGRRARPRGPVPDRAPTSATRATSRCCPRSRASTAAPARRLGSDDARTSRCASSSTTAGFSAYFVRHFMEPLVAAVWSCDPEVALDYPARYLFTFLEHHGMLGIFGSPQWRTVTGGSARVRRQGRRAAAPPRRLRDRHQGHLGPRDGRRRRGHRRQRPGVDLRRRRHRHAPRPGPGDARRADPAAARRARRDALRAQHRAPAHRHLAACRAPQGAGRRWNFPPSTAANVETGDAGRGAPSPTT